MVPLLAVGLFLALAVVIVVVSKRKPARSAPVAKTGGNTKLARKQHYRFAHMALKESVLREPDTAYDRVTKPGSGDLLINLWMISGTGLDGDDKVSPRGIRVTEPDGKVAVLHMPAPERATEAHMIGVTREGRYFVLEMGFPKDDGSPRAYVAEWRTDARIRMGDVPTIDEAAFVTYVNEVLAERKAS